jgi:poly-gamma-glutamate synthesis protein (capsule biosynthesis protein)
MNRVVDILAVLLAALAAVARGEDGCVKIGLAGDVMLGRRVNEIAARDDYAAVWGDLLPVLQDTDLNVVNLECALTTGGEAMPKFFNFRADPDRVQCLQRARIGAVNLANNHVLDFNLEGLRDTLSALGRAGIVTVGAGLTAEDAECPAIIKRKGLRIGVVGCTDGEGYWRAEGDYPGTHVFSTSDSARLEQGLRRVRPDVDVLIVSLHWGPNMNPRPLPAYRAAARRLVDAGADVVHGHSAHVCQGVEVYQGRLILYDTGDLLDDYEVNALRNDLSFLFLVEADRGGVRSLEMVPVAIENCAVRRAEAEEAQWSRARMRRLSAAFGTEFHDRGTGLELILGDAD